MFQMVEYRRYTVLSCGVGSGSVEVGLWEGGLLRMTLGASDFGKMSLDHYFLIMRDIF
jgi:hypothetical protein